MKEYNLLTRQLLVAGYSADNYPDYVEIGRTYPDKDNPLNNFDGGFEYKRWWIYERTFKTPCGLQCKGSSCFVGMRYMGIEWDYENDMALVGCPYDKADCKLKHKYLQSGGVNKFHCNVHLVDEEYQYEGSVEGIQKLHDEEIKRKKISFDLQKNGRTCQMHMHFDRDKQEWEMHYDPGECARLKCKGNSLGVEGPMICPILGRPLDKKRGNVFYDTKLTYRRYDLDGTLFEGQIDTEIIKGSRAFKNPVSMDICRNYVKLCKDELIRNIMLNKYHQELFLAKYYGREFSVEIINIRAEQRESRDLEQDLADLRDGIRISYDSDFQKEEKKRKSERRAEAKEKRIEKMEKKILDVGYENLEPIDQQRACKLIDFDRLDELKEIRQQKIKEEQEKPVQLSLFDMM